MRTAKAPRAAKTTATRSADLSVSFFIMESILHVPVEMATIFGNYFHTRSTERMTHLDGYDGMAHGWQWSSGGAEAVVAVVVAAARGR